MTTKTIDAPGTSGGYRYDVTTQAPGANRPQRIGARLWLPMLAMALMAFPVAVALAISRSTTIADGGSPTTIAALGHFVPAVMFIGFASVFAAIAFAIARILGEFRIGGGALQVTAHRRVETLRMPGTAKVFLALMAMAMMTLIGAVIAHFVIGSAVSSGSIGIDRAGQWAIWLEGVRRVGVATYLLSIGSGLAAIFTVVRFQTTRLTELPAEPPLDGAIG